MAVTGQYDHQLHPLKGWTQHYLDKVAPVNKTELATLAAWPAGRVGIIRGGYVSLATPTNVAHGASAPQPMPLYLMQGALDLDVMGLSGLGSDEKLIWVNSVPAGYIAGFVATGGYELQTTEFDSQGTYYCNTPLTVKVDDDGVGGLLVNTVDQKYGLDWVCGVCSLHCQQHWDNTAVPTTPVGTNATKKQTLTFWSYYLPKLGNR